MALDDKTFGDSRFPVRTYSSDYGKSTSNFDAKLIRIIPIDPAKGIANTLADALDPNPKVSGGLASISGYMTTKITYSLTANWDKVDGIVSGIAGNISEGLGIGNTKGGVSAKAAGYATRKYYSGGTDFSIDVGFRLFDSMSGSSSTKEKFNPGATVQNGVSFINMLMIPSNIASVSATDITDTVSKIAEDVRAKDAKEAEKNAAVKADDNYEAKVKLDDAKKELDSYGPIGKAITDSATAVMQALEMDVEATNLRLTKAPTSCLIKIGNWMVITEAIIENATFDFSEELTPKGPLYCDVNLKISTRENLILVKDDSQGNVINNVRMFNAKPETKKD